ncbi:glycosyltransferase family 25 protein [Hirsutella rhossiliensis]|uniref:Glycosyltransferase family 25 protein n=1 Tax=Hirsutella rhossiliensis TaxID=111463 RepID=A0A9P8MSE3_9HYPO|nr:glycosyltransferase family 25 protein [Hirsutella rhossiliensis]KAH0960187.1 glycosyltransferase family 25 protein [Hirsutella rhossiliensis]
MCLDYRGDEQANMEPSDYTGQMALSQSILDKLVPPAEEINTVYNHGSPTPATIRSRPRRRCHLRTGGPERMYLLAQAALPRFRRPAIVTAVNSTLGFGNVYVVSKEHCPRRRNPIQAANVTDLQLTVPIQPNWTAADVAQIRQSQNSTIGRGSLLAWLGHLYALRQFLETDDETAPFLEDNVDWDIRLRSVQVPLVSSAMRTMFPSAVDYPYGNVAERDFLYLGHCGDYWPGIDDGFEKGHVKPDDLAATPHIFLADTSLSSLNRLHLWTASLLENLGVPQHTRLVHRSRFPLCTFSYAVTRASARRLLEELSTPEPSGLGFKTFDVALLVGCRDQGLRCWTVNPELFHRVYGQSGIMAGLVRGPALAPVEMAGRVQAELCGETSNIDCGFSNGAFGFEEGDELHVEWLRREVGREGRCAKARAVRS